MATNNANSDIEILVGVQGGEDISDGSGQLISNTLKRIASEISQRKLINVTVGVDQRSTKKVIQAALNQSALKIHNISLGPNVATKLQGELNKIGLHIDIDANLKEAEKKIAGAQKRVSKQKTGAGNTSKSQDVGSTFPLSVKNSANQKLVEDSLKKLDKTLKGAHDVNTIETVKDKYAEIRKEIELCANSVDEYGYEQRIALEMAVKGINEVIAAQRKMSKNDSPGVKKDTLSSLKSFSADFEKYLKTLNPKALEESADKIKYIESLFKKDTPDAVREARNAIKEFKADMKIMGYEGGNILTFLEGKVKTFATYLISSELTNKVYEQLGKIVNTVIDLDTAMTNLQIVTGKTTDDTKELLKTYNRMAQELGSTTADVAAGATDWLRQGFSEAESAELLKQSMTLSVVGGMDAEAATTAITAALKGLELQASSASDVVDKFFKVDMMAATSAEKLAVALSKTAANAKVAGISIDDVIGQLAVVSETLSEAGESTGTFYNTMLSRMASIKSGRLIDPETSESLSNVETTLNRLGIALRDQQGQFRNFGEVLNEVGAAWDSYGSTSQRAIAAAFAGTHHQTRFLTLMEGWETAAKYSEAAANSSGVAAQKLEVYQESLAAKQAKLTASFEAFSQTILNSDLVGLVLDLSTGFMNLASNLPAAGFELAEIATVIFGLVTGFNMLKTSPIGSSFKKTFSDLGWPKKTGDIVPIYSKKTA